MKILPDNMEGSWPIPGWIGIFVGLMLVTIGLILVLFFGQGYLGLREFSLNSQIVKGEVTAPRRCRSRTGPLNCHEVYYRVDGEDHRVLSRIGSLSPGLIVDVRYSPKDPGVSQILNEWPVHLEFLADLRKSLPVFCLFLAFLVFGIFSLIATLKDMFKKSRA